MSSSDLDPQLLARLDAVPALAGRLSVEPLDGGLTNHNLLVRMPQGAYVARLSSPESALLAIDREAEAQNSASAAASGAAPPVIAYAPEVGVLVVEYIEGRTWGNAQVLDPTHTERLVAAVQRLHAGAAFRGTFDMRQVQQRYLTLCRERGFAIPDDYLDYATPAAHAARALDVRQVPLVPCNNDLLAANVIDDGQRLWLIDYEYSGQNDPFFELGNICSEAVGTPQDLERIVTAYVGQLSPPLIARAHLWATLAKYGWMLWAAIQSATSDLDFDFWAWGLEKYDRAVAEFESPEFARQLQEVRRIP